jgi:hypothetical protein
MRAVIPVAALLLATSPAEAADATTRSMSTKVEGGYELGAMYGRPMHGGRLRVGLGSQNDAMALWATLSGRYGVSFTGVPTWDVRIGGDSELLRSGIFHAGGGADIGVHGYTVQGERDVVNHTESAVRWALSLGLSGRAGIDVLRFRDTPRSALTLDARLDGHVFFWGYYASACVLAGARF